jgi:hypothetical protein
MANVFGILTAIILALAAFIATKNKAAYEKEISETAEQKTLLTKSKARLTAAEAVLADLPVQRAAVEAEIVKLKEAEDAQQAVNAKLKSDFDAKTTTVGTNKVKLDDIREKTGKTGNIKELASKMNAIKGDLEQLDQSITGTNAKLADFTAQNAQKESEINSLQNKFKNYSNGESDPSLKTRIRSIYPNWGFVTLASGNNAGVVTNSTLDVVRDGQTIAKLLVTAVESSTASASVIPDTISPDVTLMVGDRVTPGQKVTKPAAAN